MTLLDELGKKYNTDKYHFHRYTSIYDIFLKDIRETATNILELGIFAGASLYFANSIL